MLDNKKRYLQIAFNDDIAQVANVLPSIPLDERILIEAGTPYIKREGFRGISYIRSRWNGFIVADVKVSDGAEREIDMVVSAGANAVTVLGSAPEETLNIFVTKCADINVVSMIDMLGVDKPLDTLRKLKLKPDVVVLHLGRDEEQTKGKLIQYKQVNKIRSKFDTIISAAGGVDVKQASSAIFNGANIVVANIVNSNDPWTGISTDSQVESVAREFLKVIA